MSLYTKVFFPILFVTTLFVNAQTKLIDSLEVLIEETPSDSIKINALNQLSKIYWKTNADKHYETCLEGLTLAKELNDTLFILGFTKRLSQREFDNGNIDIALEQLDEVLPFLNKKTFPTPYLGYLTSKADMLKHKGEYDNAAQLYFEAIETAKEIESAEAFLSIYIGFAGLYLSQDKPAEGLKYLYEALPHCDELKKHRIQLCNSIIYTNLSAFYAQLEESDSALYYSIKSIEIKEAENNLRGLEFSYNNVASIYMSLNSLNEARQYYNKAIEVSRKFNNKSGLIRSLTNLLILNNKEGLYQKNASIVAELDRLIETYQNPEDKQKYYKGKARYLANIGQFKQAYETNILQYEINDSINNIEQTEVIANLEKKYESEKLRQEKKLAETETYLQKEKTKRARLISIAAVLFTIIVVLLLVNIFNKLRLIKQQKLKLNEAYKQLEIAKKNELAVSNLKALQSQMNPHFIFNALNSVQDLVLLKDIRNSNKYLGKFSDLIRKILLSSKEQFISLSEEIDILTLYLDLEKLRFGDDFSVDFIIEVNEESQDKIMIPAMFIQPYIENAIKHGLFHKLGQKDLKVHFQIKNQTNNSAKYLSCIIEDNGIGQEKAAEMKIKNLHLHTGFSTEAINERIRLLNETLSKKIELTVVDLLEGSQPKGTRVTIDFPV